MLGWGAYLAIDGQITGGMVIAASIIAGRALAPIEGAIEGWNTFIIARQAYDRIRRLLVNSKLQFEKLNLPQPEGRLDVERLLYVPGGHQAGRAERHQLLPRTRRSRWRSSAIPAPARRRSARCWWARSCRPRATCGST